MTGLWAEIAKAFTYVTGIGVLSFGGASLWASDDFFLTADARIRCGYCSIVLVPAFVVGVIAWRTLVMRDRMAG